LRETGGENKMNESEVNKRWRYLKEEIKKLEEISKRYDNVNKDLNRARENYEYALRAKYLSGQDLTKDEAVIKFLFDMALEDEENEKE
jgi:2-hydroxychromene-2-carboxylate isomerase